MGKNKRTGEYGRGKKREEKRAGEQEQNRRVTKEGVEGRRGDVNRREERETSRDREGKGRRVISILNIQIQPELSFSTMPAIKLQRRRQEAHPSSLPPSAKYD